MNFETIATGYVDTWNATTQADRTALLEKYWASDASYIDPIMSGNGREGVGEMIAKAREQFPGHAFALHGKVDGHGGQVRFSWALAPANGAAVVKGTDFVSLTGDGRIAKVVGFIDMMP